MRLRSIMSCVRYHFRAIPPIGAPHQRKPQHVLSVFGAVFTLTHSALVVQCLPCAPTRKHTKQKRRKSPNLHTLPTGDIISTALATAQSRRTYSMLRVVPYRSHKEKRRKRRNRRADICPNITHIHISKSKGGGCSIPQHRIV